MTINPISFLTGAYKPIPPNTVALITGGSHGIGRSIAIELAKRRCYIIIVGRDQSALTDIQTQLVCEYKIKCATIRQDMTEIDAAEQILSEINKLNLTIDILVNNAGIANNGPFNEQSTKDIQDLIVTNNLTTLKLTNLLIPHMLQKQRGWILTVSSLAAYISGPGNATYHASKSFLTNWSYSLHYELKNKNINVSQICPGPVFETELGHRAKMDTAWGLIIGPGHLPHSIAKLAVDGLENNNSNTIALRHQLPVIISKLAPQDMIMWIGQLFNSRKAVPESVRKARFTIAHYLGI